MRSTARERKKVSTTTAGAAGVKPNVEAIEAVEGTQADYETFLPAARALAPRDVQAFHADASLAYHNVDAGVTAVLGARAAIDTHLRDADWNTIQTLPNLALAVCFATTQAATTGEPASRTQALLATARQLRKLLIGAADMLATAKLVPQQDVDAIHRGHGPIDLANDCVNLAALFRKYAPAIAGKHAVPAASVTQAAATGTALLAVLRPKETKRVKPAAHAAAADVRDRMWTLLVAAHRELRRLGMAEWVDDVNDHVPLLQTHRGNIRTKKTGSAKPPRAPAAPAATAATT